MLLRSRQQEFVDKCMVALADNDNTLGVAPTGAGKTLMLSKVIGNFYEQNPSLRACVLAHRDELTAQNEEKFRWVNPAISTSIVDSYRKSWDGNVTFAMVQTLSRESNLEQMPSLDLLVIDEAHHVTAPSYRNVLEHARKVNPELKLLGVTATPERGDKSSLGEVFNNCCDQIKIGELILSGNLVKPVTFAIDMGNVTEKLQALRTRSTGDYSEAEVASILDSEPLNSEVVRHWREKAGERKTVIFCSSVAHARNVTNSFNAAGISAALITGEMTKEHRVIVFENMTKGMIQVIVNVAVLTEGWDYPPISCVVLLRMTSFQSTMIQMVGRGLRTVDQREYPGLVKTDCVILDFGISSILHGTLEQQINLYPKKPEDNEAPTKTCPRCSTKVFIKERFCPQCGHEFEAQDKDIRYIDEMEEIRMLKMSVFSWHRIQIDKMPGHCLLAHGFKTWSCVIKKGEHYLTICGSNNSKEYDIETQIIYKGDKAVAISKGNDFLYERESEEEAWKSASWRQYPPSDKQINFIAKSNTRYILEENTKGAAAAVIAFEINVKKELNKLANVA
jgi:superfamily II DNA or RNA helicase